MEKFIQNLPKIELHAHLNGSLSDQSVLELAKMLYGVNSKQFLEFATHFTECKVTDLNNGFEKFKFMHQLTATFKGLELATTMVIKDFVKDNVVHLELRTTPKGNDNMTQQDYLECVISAMLKAQQKYQSINIKLIPSFDRSKPVQLAEETLDVVLSLKSKYKNLIVGIDLSGNPNLGKFKNFEPLLKKARENGLKIALHCAEVDNPEEVNQMIEFGMQRCGHGTFLNITQLQELAERNIAIECCLTSNVICKTVSSYNDHHFKHIFECDGAVVLCTDDSGVFHTSLSNELLIAAKTFNLNMEDILRLSLNAVEHSFTDEDEKTYLMLKVKDYFKNNMWKHCN